MHSESSYAMGALLFGSCPVIAMRMVKADPDLLQTSLAKALAAHPIFAGRLSFNLFDYTGKVQVLHQGVPFTVVRIPEASAPVTLEEGALFSYADLRNPRSILKGKEPLMTIKLSIYKDGSAVLGIARSHAIADGSYIWSFLAAWACVSRGGKTPQFCTMTSKRLPRKPLKKRGALQVRLSNTISSSNGFCYLRARKAWWWRAHCRSHERRAFSPLSC